MSGTERQATPEMLTVDQGSTVNVALGKQAAQSSTDDASRVKDPAEDACGAVNGEITGSYGFHTGHEHGPWWQVDLGGPTLISDIVIYNRVDQPGLEDRALPLEILLSDDGQSFRVGHKQDERFGGKDGTPLRWSPSGGEQARFVRLLVPRMTCLHLDEVEVYGRPWEPTGLPAGMGQTSALGSVDEFLTATPRADEVAPVDFNPAETVPAGTTAETPPVKQAETFLAWIRRALFGR